MDENMDNETETGVTVVYMYILYKEFGRKRVLGPVWFRAATASRKATLQQGQLATHNSARHRDIRFKRCGDILPEALKPHP